VAVIVALARHFDFAFAPGYLETTPMTGDIVKTGPFPTPRYSNSLTLPLLDPLRVKIKTRADAGDA
jgi:hypothetical protein